MRKILAIMLVASVSLGAGVPHWILNSAAAGRHKLYASAPGDQGPCEFFQITAGSANITISLHTYTKGTRATGDDGWVPIGMAAARGDTNLSVLAGETVQFTFDKGPGPEAYFISGGSGRVLAE